jgi:hypothetical protein
LKGGVSPSCRFPVALSWPLVVKCWCVSAFTRSCPFAWAHDMVAAQGWAPLRTISSRMCLGQI